MRVSRFAKPVLALAAVCGLAFACANTEDPAAQWVARVGNDVITRGELDAELAAIGRSDLAPASGSAEARRLRQQTLDDLLRERLLLYEAKRRNIVVTSDEVKERMQGVLTPTEDTPEEYKKHLDLSALSPVQFKKRIEDELRIEKLFTRDIYPRLLVTEADARAVYDAKPDAFRLPERVRVWQIVTANELDAGRVRQRLAQGDPFSRVAREMSIMPEKDRGGDLGWIMRGGLPEPFDKLVFELPLSVVSQPIVSPYGIHLLYIAASEPAVLPPFEQVRQRAEHLAFEAKKREAEAGLLAHLRERLHIQTNPDFFKEGQETP